MPGQFPRGHFVWHELITSDTRAAAAFYTRLIGWQTQAWERASSYIMWMAGKTAVGGLMPLTEEERRINTSPYWLPYIATPDADATTRRAVEMGGKVLTGPIDMPTVGRFTVVQDPQGAVFAAFRPAGDQDGRVTDARMGDFSWHELCTSDPKSAWQFYETLFGWRKTSAVDMGPAGSYQMFSWGAKSVGGIYTKPAAMAMAPSHWLPYVRIANPDKAAELGASLGGKVTTQPMNVAGGDRIAVLQDPQGAPFGVHSLKSKGSRGKAAKGKPAKKSKPRKKPIKKKSKTRR